MIINRLKEFAKDKKDRIAYRIDDESITYGDLWNKIEEYSLLLSRNGSSPVILYGDKSINYLVLMLSLIKAKRAYVPVGSCTPLERLKNIIKYTNSSLLITDKKIEIDNIEIVNFNNIDKIKNKNNTNNKNDIAYIIFTSGSTGEPKGVPISYNNLNNFTNWISNLKPLSEYKNINVLNQASFSFDLSVADVFYSLNNGHTLVSYNDNYENIYDILLKNNINVAVVTPTFMKLCLVDSSFNEEHFKELKCIYFCGEMLNVKLVEKLYERFPNISIINAYGPTEATSAVCAILIDKEMLNNSLLPVGNIKESATKIEIIDNEIVLKGESVFQGYINNIQGGYYLEEGINCYKTGDFGYIKDDLIYVKGRIDNQIKYKGYRIELDDIENNIKNIKGIKDSIVTAIFDDNNVVKTIKAFVEVEDPKYDEQYIRDELDKLIPKYMLPKTINIVDKIPITCNNKLDRKALSKL